MGFQLSSGFKILGAIQVVNELFAFFKVLKNTRKMGKFQFNNPNVPNVSRRTAIVFTCSFEKTSTFWTVGDLFLLVFLLDLIIQMAVDEVIHNRRRSQSFFP